MPKKAQTKEERAAAHRASVKKSYLKNHGKNKEKGRARMAEMRKRLNKSLHARRDNMNVAAPDDASDNDGVPLSDLDIGIDATTGRFSSPAVGSVSGEETEAPESCSYRQPDPTRFSSPVAGSVSGEESIPDTGDRIFWHRMATKEQADGAHSRPPIPGLTYVDLPDQSIFEQMSYDLDEEVEIAKDLLGAKGFREMVEDDKRRMERFQKSGGRMISYRK